MENENEEMRVWRFQFKGYQDAVVVAPTLVRALEAWNEAYGFEGMSPDRTRELEGRPVVSR
jgi:hypothetical protein